MSASQSPLVVKPHTPTWLIAAVAFLAIFLLVGIFFAIFTLHRDITDARMTGTIIAKNFESQPQREISLGKNGLRSEEIAGIFTLTVAVPQRDGTTRDFTVWVPESLYNSVSIGDSFDVGPYLVPSKSEQ
jgi:hypothetical protein